MSAPLGSPVRQQHPAERGAGAGGHVLAGTTLEDGLWEHLPVPVLAAEAVNVRAGGGNRWALGVPGAPLIHRRCVKDGAGTALFRVQVTERFPPAGGGRETCHHETAFDFIA